VDHRRARDLYYKYRAAVAYVAVETPAGDESIGTAFHVGDNIWVTAAHVVEGNRILEIGTTESSIDDYSARLEATGGVLMGDWYSRHGFYRLADEPMLHPDGVDVAALRLEGPFISKEQQRPYPALEPPRSRPDTPVVPLGGWLDDWLGHELTLEPVIVMGYPPIPFGRGPLLVTARAEINTVLDKRQEKHPYFIVSTMARGGFSGSLVMTEFENALGVTTESLVKDHAPAELGYFAVLAVEPVYICLEHHGVLPPVQDLDGIFKVAESGPPPPQS
jgi:hypothetical protein